MEKIVNYYAEVFLLCPPIFTMPFPFAREENAVNPGNGNDVRARGRHDSNLLCVVNLLCIANSPCVVFLVCLGPLENSETKDSENIDSEGKDS